MNQDDLVIARDVRRYLERRAIDCSLAVVSCNKGFVTVTGTIRRLRSQPFVELQDEMDMFVKQVSRNLRDVRGVNFDARIQKSEKHEKEVRDANTAYHASAPGVAPKPNVPGHH